MINTLVSIFNNFVIGLLSEFYKYFDLNTLEDSYHKKKKIIKKI